MNLESQILISAGTLLVAVGVAWGINKKGGSRNELDIENLWKEMSKIRGWQMNHDKDASEIRIGIERRINEVSSLAMRGEDRYKDLKVEMQRTQEKLDRLIDMVKQQ